MSNVVECMKNWNRIVNEILFREVARITYLRELYEFQMSIDSMYLVSAGLTRVIVRNSFL